MKTVGNYQVKEPTVEDVPDMFELMTGGQVEVQVVIQSMLNNCVFAKGSNTPLGLAGVKTLPLRCVRDLVEELTEMTGLNEKK